MRSTAGRRVLPAAVMATVLVAVLAVPAAPALAQETGNGTTTFAFDLRADGDARVSVTTGFALESAADREGFERLAEDHTDGTGSPLSVDPFERAAAEAADATGRPMEVRAVSRSASHTNQSGQLTLQFTWTNFTDPDDDRMAVGDAFRTPEGTWLPGLRADQELVIRFPPGYTPQSITMPGTRYRLDNGTVRVEGPTSFEPGTPSLVLQQTGNGPQAGLPGPWTVAAVAVATVGALVVLFRDRLPAIGGDGEDEPDAVVDVREDGEEPDPMEEPLLSDEERVLKLLAARGGRMKQVEIVQATDWSNAKVSQLLSEMEEHDRVDKLRIGRENLISLPGEGPSGER